MQSLMLSLLNRAQSYKTIEFACIRLRKQHPHLSVNGLVSQAMSSSTTTPSLATTANSSAPSKLRILCLHGYLQNAEVFHAFMTSLVLYACLAGSSTSHTENPSADYTQVFSGRIGSMRKALKSRAEFIFIDAPHEAVGEEAETRAAEGTGDHPRTWWHWEVFLFPTRIYLGVPDLSMHETVVVKI